MDPAVIAMLVNAGTQIFEIVMPILLGFLATRGAAATVNANMLNSSLARYKAEKAIHLLAGQHGKATK